MEQGKVIYLDYNATTPYAKSVKEIMIDAAENFWGNPSSNYGKGRNAKNVIEKSREHVADMIEASASEIIFVSGGTEANNTIIRGVIEDSRPVVKPHVVSTLIEHDATLKLLQQLMDKDEITVTFLPTNVDGSVDPKSVKSAIEDNTVLVTLMLANNETGAVTDMKEMCAIIEEINTQRLKENNRRVYVHIDAAQALGKIQVSVKETPVDYLTIVGHKFYGPRTGAIYVKAESSIRSLLYGGGQENGRRPGTENTVCVAGLGEAARLVYENIEKYYTHYKKMKDYLKTLLLKEFPKGACLINFPEDSEHRQLPNTLSVSFPGRSGSHILDNCPYLEASTGAACHSSANRKTASKVLTLLLPEEQAIGTLRLSLGRETTESDLDLAVGYIRESINRL